MLPRKRCRSWLGQVRALCALRALCRSASLLLRRRGSCSRAMWRAARPRRQRRRARRSALRCGRAARRGCADCRTVAAGRSERAARWSHGPSGAQGRAGAAAGRRQGHHGSDFWLVALGRGAPLARPASRALRPCGRAAPGCVPPARCARAPCGGPELVLTRFPAAWPGLGAARRACAPDAAALPSAGAVLTPGCLARPSGAGADQRGGCGGGAAVSGRDARGRARVFPAADVHDGPRGAAGARG